MSAYSLEARLTALLPSDIFVQPKRGHQNAQLFIFTPPGAAVRFADGARKSFSIATCLGWVFWPSVIGEEPSRR